MSHDNNNIPKLRDNTRKCKNSGTPQLQLNDDMKKDLNTLTGGTGDATDEYEPDFKGDKRRDLNIMSTLQKKLLFMISSFFQWPIIIIPETIL